MHYTGAIICALALCFLSTETIAWDQAEINAGIEAHKMALSADGRYVLVVPKRFFNIVRCKYKYQTETEL